MSEKFCTSAIEKFRDLSGVFVLNLEGNKLFMYVKRFLEWIGLKERLHSKLSRAPYVNEGEIWWASIGENVGFEINGKSKFFTRPVVIFRKLTHSYYLVIPLTTKDRSGSWYVPIQQGGKKMAVCLQHVRSIDYRRLFSKLGELDDLDHDKVKEGFAKLYLKKIFPR
jgi:mRNA interferase MazF